MTSKTMNDAEVQDERFRERSGAHVARYIATDGAEGYDDNSHKAPTLLLTTIGRRSGEARVFPLYFAEHEGSYIIIASKGGADTHPQWYLNLVAEPRVEVQILGEKFSAIARTADSEEKERLWPLLADAYPFYNDYQQGTDRDIPLVVLEPLSPPN